MTKKSQSLLRNGEIINILISIFLGIICGILAFVPLFVALKLSKKVTRTSNMGYTGLTLIGLFVSMLILAISVAVCYFVAKDVIVFFAISVAVTLSVTAIGYGIYNTISVKKFAEERKSGFEKKEA